MSLTFDCDSSSKDREDQNSSAQDDVWSSSILFERKETKEKSCQKGGGEDSGRSRNTNEECVQDLNNVIQLFDDLESLLVVPSSTSDLVERVNY